MSSILASLFSINLAIFYIRGTYHTVTQRLLRTSYITTVPPNPNIRQPSYALLGVLVLARLAHNAYKAFSDAIRDAKNRMLMSEKARGKLPDRSDQTKALEPTMEKGSMYLDFVPVKEILAHQDEEDLDAGMPVLVPTTC